MNLLVEGLVKSNINFLKDKLIDLHSRKESAEKILAETNEQIAQTESDIAELEQFLDSETDKEKEISGVD